MKKKFFSLILCLLTALPSSAGVLNGYDAVSFAGHTFPLASTNWSVILKDVSCDKCALLGGASWDAATKTLTLDGSYSYPNIVDIELLFVSEKTGIWIDNHEDITVNVKGNCRTGTRKGSALRIYGPGNITLTGNGLMELSGSKAD